MRERKWDMGQSLEKPDPQNICISVDKYIS